MSIAVSTAVPAGREQDLELVGGLSSSDSDSNIVEETNSAWRVCIVGRTAAVGACAAAALICVLGSRSPAAHAVASPSSSPSLPIIGLADAGALDAQTAAQAASAQLMGTNKLAKAPLEKTNDGNVCGDDEELLGGLCYASCSGLTAGWDIAGMREGEAICPHKPGVCLEDEELFLDLCFMKCSILTVGKYNFRSAAATCCKQSSGVGCFVQDGVSDGLNGQALTDKNFDVGGGCNDANENTRCKPHPPQEALTETASTV